MVLLLEPAEGTITQRFGEHPEWAWQLGYGHLGRDTANVTDTPVYAIADGVVLAADWGQNWPLALCQQWMFVFGPGGAGTGIGVLIQHDGWAGLGAHMNSTALNVGDRVKRGQIIGYMGTSGNSTGTHLHFETMLPNPPAVAKWGRYDCQLQIDYENTVAASQSLAPNQRKNGPAPAPMRPEAKPSDVVLRTIPEGSIENFTGYVIGQSVTVNDLTSNIWYMDNGDDGNGDPRYVWAGFFQQQVTAGLTNRTPPPPPAPGPAPILINQRRVGPGGATMRKAPLVDPNNITGRVAAPDSVENFTHWYRGQAVTSGGITTDLWYKDSTEWAWAGAFTEQTTDGLTLWSPPVVVVEPPYTFEKGLPSITEVLPAAKGKYEVGNIPVPPDGIVLHQFNADQPSENPVTNKDTVHIGSVIETFTKINPDPALDRVASAHVACEKSRRIQFVYLRDRAYHAGKLGNNLWGIEIYGGMDAETVASVVMVILDMEKEAGKDLPLSRHSEHMATKCGVNVDLDMFRALVAEAKKPPVVVVPPDDPAGTKLIEELTTVVNKYEVRIKP